MAGMSEARAAKREVSALLRGDPRVTGVGVARRGDGYAVRVNLVADDADLRRSLPRRVGGAPVVVQVVGPVTAQAG